MAGQSAARARALDAVKSGQRRAGQKVSRLRKAGINTESIDPRVDASSHANMTTGQLQAYARRLDAFTSRSTSFVAGNKGTPLNGNTWRAYKRAEAIYNAKSNNFYDSVRGLTIPTLNVTVEKYLKSLSEDRRQGDYKTFGELVRETPGGITSDKALARITRSMLARADGDYLAKEAALQRRIINKMLRRTSNSALIPTIRDMSDEEVITLQYTEFMPTLENSYSMATSINTDTPRYQSSVYEDNTETVQALADWAAAHFGNESTEQDAGSTRQGRDEYGRFVKRGSSNPEPHFNRDAQGRFARRSQ